MRVLVMDTGRGIDAEKVAMWRVHLGLEESDSLSLVSWFQPAMHLPLARHLVCGPVLRAEPHPWPVQAPGTAVTPAQAPSSAGTAQAGTGQPLGEATDGLASSELDEQLTEQEAGPAQAAAADLVPENPADLGPHAGTDVGETTGVPTSAGPVPDRQAAAPPPTDLSHLPLHDPRRVRQAIRWRRKWAQRRASRFAGRQLRRGKKVKADVLDVATDWRRLPLRARNAPSTALGTVLRRRKDGISWEFAIATTRSRAVHDLFRTADLVVPVDQRSQKAAWLLARRHPGPDVFVTLPSAARALAARRSRG